MYATHVPRRWTVEEVLNLPADGNRYEVVHGELLVTPSPAVRHQLVITRLFAALAEYLRPLGLTDVLFAGPVDFFHGSEVYVVPDLVVATPGEISSSWRSMRHLRLAVEVLSPSSVRGDRIVKRKAYRDAGVETYWVVDPERAVVEVWRPGDGEPEVARRELRWSVTAEAPELVVNLVELFDNLPV